MRLADYLASAKPFDWRENNCAQFVSGWLVANGRPDPMAGLEPTTDLLATRRLVRALGGFVEAVNQRLGEPIPIDAAKEGDIVHFELTDGGFALAIVAGPVSAALGVTGLEWLPTSAASHAWAL